MDCDYDPRKEKQSKFKKQTRSSGRKGHKKTKFAQVIDKKKPLFNPSDKTFQQYLDEYYGLEFEDIIGNMPCRFKYRKVIPNSFGLTIEEILAADDKELNNWCSMQKIISLRPEQNEKFDLKTYLKRGQNMDIKKKFLPSLFKNENNENSCINTSEEVDSQKKKKKKKRKSKSNPSIIQKTDVKNSVPRGKNNNSAIETYDDNHRKSTKRKADSDVNEDVKNPAVNSKFQKRDSLKMNEHKFDNKRCNKFKFQKFVGKNCEEVNISDERLKAYGINPKRYKNKLKYGGNKN